MEGHIKNNSLEAVKETEHIKDTINPTFFCQLFFGRQRKAAEEVFCLLFSH
jgi:hypothetical protein